MKTEHTPLWKFVMKNLVEERDHLKAVNEEILEALETIEECVSGMDQSTLDEDFEKALQKVRTIIKKVKGE